MVLLFCGGLVPDNRIRIEFMLDAGCFHGWGGGPVCSSLSSAVRPPCRSKQKPYGLPGLSKEMKKKVRAGNSFARWCAHLIKRYHTRLWFWVENPQLSWFWRLPCIQCILCRRHVGAFLQLDYCRFGTPWRKRTRFFTNLRSLMNVQCFCLGGHDHLLLQGASPSGAPWTKVAEPYPQGVAKVLALSVACHCGWEHGPVDIAGVSQAASLG